MQLEEGVWTNHSLRSLGPVLKSWTAECARYTRIANDASWWHNERASVSVLAVAAARTEGWVALEEYPTKKGTIDVDGSRRGLQGRCDLWLRGGQRDCAIEFKLAWQPLTSRGDGLGRVHIAWDAAWKASGNLAAGEAEWRFAGIFVSPFLKASKLDRKTLTTRLIILKEAVRRLEGVAALGWYFPRSGHEWKSECGYIYPGAIVALRQRKRAERTRLRNKGA